MKKPSVRSLYKRLLLRGRDMDRLAHPLTAALQRRAVTPAEFSKRLKEVVQFDHLGGHLVAGH